MACKNEKIVQKITFGFLNHPPPSSLDIVQGIQFCWSKKEEGKRVVSNWLKWQEYFSRSKWLPLFEPKKCIGTKMLSNPKTYVHKTFFWTPKFGIEQTNCFNTNLFFYANQFFWDSTIFLAKKIQFILKKCFFLQNHFNHSNFFSGCQSF